MRLGTTCLHTLLWLTLVQFAAAADAKPEPVAHFAGADFQGGAKAPEKYVIRRDLHKDFWVTLPAEKRPFPEPLPEGKPPGFKIRGTKGWMWTPQQTMAEIPVLAGYQMNFFMNCYGCMCDIEHY